MTDAHREWLTSAAITPATIERLGIRSLEVGGTCVAVLFPWKGANPGESVTSAHPDTPRLDAGGRPVKYEWPARVKPIVWVARDAGPGTPVVLVEGHKQSLAVASWAPDGMSVHGMNGCRGWAGTDLSWADGRAVVVMLDADAATNSDVYAAGEKLAEALDIAGADSVRFARIPAEGTDGADDWLASVPESRRTGHLERVIARATDRPAKRKPAPKAKDKIPDPPTHAAGSGPATSGDGRPVVVVNDDRLAVLDAITDAMVTRWDATRLFNYGGALTAVHGSATKPLSAADLLNVIAETVATFKIDAKGNTTPDWPDAPTRMALGGRASRFSVLDRVVSMPFVRPDGTVCADPGYDRATRTFASLADDVTGVKVAEDPSPGEVAAARDFLLTEWLGDMPWRDDASRAGALALVLTPFIRGLVPLAPMAVVSAKQMSSGKNLLADVLGILWTGQPVDVSPYNDDDEETRKTVTSLFRAGAEVVCFDEAHSIGSKSLARAITATSYQDRVLGRSEVVAYPNRVTWFSLGNQVVVNGDMSRRVHYVELWPAEENPQDRDPDSFRHSDLRSWTLANRADLVAAVLTLVRAWFVAGQPRGERTEAMGSFERWDRTVGGILAVAGVPGFLGNLKARRSESDWDGAAWVHHFAWLATQFRDGEEFTASAVTAKAAAPGNDLETWPGPPNLTDPVAKGFTRELGKSYARVIERWYGGVSIAKADTTAHGHVTKYRLRVRPPREG